jgi:FKBP-type peptidyl-prolyl cis-trans isomerase FkpA
VKKTTLILLSVLSVFVLSSCGKLGSGASLKTDDDKTVYAVGVLFGQRFQELSLTGKEVDLVTAGVRDILNGKAQINPNEYQTKIQTLFRDRMNKKAEEQKTVGDAYIKKFVAEEAGKLTATGLGYKVLKEGTGRKPLETETVEVHYTGTLIDGTVFDSSRERQKTAQFPLNRVIKGWTEGLQLIGEGGQIKLVIPADLAYGPTGAPPKIPGGATLVFDIEVLKVSKTEEPKAAAPAVAPKKEAAKAPVKKAAAKK